MQNPRYLLTLIILIAGIARFSNLDKLPSGFIPEEVSTGWNAYSLLQTGRDEWGVRFPLIFKETGGFKLALNSYLIVPVMAVFGANEFSVRFPTAFAGLLAVGLTYFLTKRLFGKDSFALSAAFLLAISPWHVAMGRYAVDVNWGIPLFLAGIICFLKGETDPGWLVPAAIFFGLTYFTYFNFIVFTLLFLAGLFFIRRKNINWQQKKYPGAFVVIQILFLLPYLISSSLFIRFSQATSVGRIGIINQIHEHREACITTYPLLVCRLVYNKPVVFGLEIVRNYLNHFSTTTYFLTGSNLGLSGMPARNGLIYLFEFPLLIVGLVYLIRNRKFSPLLGLWLFLYGFPSSLAADGHVWRMLTFLPLPQIIAGVGLVKILTFKKNPLLTVSAAIVISFFVIRFTVDYVSFLPYAQGDKSYFGFAKVYELLKTKEKDYDFIVVAPTGLGFDQLYIYYLFYMRPDPRQYQLGIDVERETGIENWVHVSRIGKWHFISDIRNMSNLPQKVLAVTDGQFKTEELLTVGKETFRPRLLETVYYANHQPAFKIIEFTSRPPV